MKEFDDAYKKLNKEQKEAVDAIEGPVFVVAGPGTGKTQILTLRIANIIRKTDTEPENILAITFTESGAHAMRKRLHEIIGANAYKVTINTFHGFCNLVINRFPEYFGRIIGRVSIEDGEKLKIIEEIISENDFKLIKPFGDKTYYVYPALSAISELKREDIDISDFEKSILQSEKEYNEAPDKVHEKGPHKGKVKGEFIERLRTIEKNKELLVVYREYEKKLEEQKYFDFEDMLLEVVRELKRNQDLLLILQENYQYILADEHQDANRAQNELLELLSSYHDNPNLFLVGDEKQAIYRFQGASLENFHYFTKKYKDSKVITLSHNYRSDQKLLDVTNKLARGNIVTEDKFVSLISGNNNKKGAEVYKYNFTKNEDENTFLVNSIKEKINSGTPPEEIAILYRNNKDSEVISDYLSREGVPYVVLSDSNIFDDIVVIKFITFLKAIGDISNEKNLSSALFLDFLELPIEDVFVLISYANKRRQKISYVISNELLLKDAGIKNIEKFIRVFNLIRELAKLGKNELLTDSFEKIARQSGFLEHILKLPNSLEALSTLDALFDFMRSVVGENRNARLEDFLQKINMLQGYGKGLKRRAVNAPQGLVRLLTAHKSKGLEFDVVYIPYLDNKHWGEKRSKTMFDLPIESFAKGTLADERRLFYVAMTRAREQLILSHSEEDDNGAIKLQSPFVDEIIGPEINIGDVAPYNGSKSNSIQKLKVKTNHGIPISDKDFLKEKFLEQGLAVTALNNYLECPAKYFFVNLIRLPQEQTRDQQYGIAVHFALKETIDRLVKGEDVSDISLLGAFSRKLAELPLNESDFKDSEVRGQKSLTGYFEARSSEWRPPMLTEVRVEGVPFDVNGNIVTLKGVFDRIDVLDNGNVKVLDYKTSKPKSRNEIEGKTASSLGNEKRQLIFYQLLMDSYYKDKFKMVSGVIDFVEPDTKGNYKREEFVINEEEVSELKDTVRRVCEEIIEFNFIDNGCKKADCEYCLLAEIII